MFASYFQERTEECDTQAITVHGQGTKRHCESLVSCLKTQSIRQLWPGIEIQTHGYVSATLLQLLRFNSHSPSSQRDYERPFTLPFHTC